MFKHKTCVAVCGTMIKEEQNFYISACHFALQTEQPLSKYLGSSLPKYSPLLCIHTENA